MPSGRFGIINSNRVCTSDVTIPFTALRTLYSPGFSSKTPSRSPPPVCGLGTPLSDPTTFVKPLYSPCALRAQTHFFSFLESDMRGLKTCPLPTNILSPPASFSGLGSTSYFLIFYSIPPAVFFLVKDLYIHL